MKHKAHKILATVTNNITEVAGKPGMFAGMVILIIAWFVAGIFFRYDESWFNILDVFVFLVTFFMVFAVQSSQNADTKAMQDKLDELLDSLSKSDKSKEGEEEDFKEGKDDA